MANKFRVFWEGSGNTFLHNGLFLLFRSEGEREKKIRGDPLFAKSRIPPHPLRQKLLKMILQSCAVTSLSLSRGDSATI